jgi:phosphoribosylformylglycinamidine (FGAM) synthase PurS component
VIKIDVAIELIIPDNTAFTVLTALRHLGYDDLQKVERSEHVMLGVADGAETENIIHALSRAEVLFNPNKHRMSYAAAAGAQAAVPPEFEAIVRDKDENNERLVTLLAATFGMTALRELSRAVGWRLYDKRGPATRERLEWACRTLLANPISQAYDIRPRPVRRQVRELTHDVAKRGQ